MGADFIQYIVADEQLVTPLMATHFSEEVINLPHDLVSLTMTVSNRKMTKEEFSLPTNSFVFYIKTAKKAGITFKKLIFVGKLPHTDYIARYRLANLFLDTFSYNAGATAIASLQASLPILTLTSDSFAARMEESIATAAGYPQFIRSFIFKNWYNYDKLIEVS